MLVDEQFDIVVIGAGIAGLAALNRASAEPVSVLCVDTLDRIGGNHRSVDIGPYTFDIGSFIFHEGYPMFEEYPELKNLRVPFTPSNQRLSPAGTVCKYPYETREILTGRPFGMARNALSLAYRRLTSRRPVDAGAYIDKILGRGIARDLGLHHYVRRFYGVSPSEIDPGFVDARMKFILTAARPGAIAKTLYMTVVAKLKRRAPALPKRTVYARARAGFEAYFAPVRAKLEARGVEFRLGARLGSIASVPDGFVIALDGSEVRAKRVINTIPLELLWPLLSPRAEPDPPLQLSSSGLVTLFLSFEGGRGFEAAVFFNFHPDGRWKRLTMHSDVYGRADGREFLCVEVPNVGDESPDPSALFADFCSHTRRYGLFAGDLRLEGHTVTEFAYPVYTIGYEKALTAAIGRIEQFGLETVGRQGRFDYLPTSSGVMAQVNRILDRGAAARDRSRLSSSGARDGCADGDRPMGAPPV